MRITILGLGHVGLPMAAVLAGQGHQVQGVDTDAGHRAALAAGEAGPELSQAWRAALGTGRVTIHAAPRPADIFLIAVPTPLGPGNAPDLSHVDAAGAAIAPVMAEGALVLLESTVPIGATAGLGAQLAALRPDMDCHVAHAPERVLPGRLLTEMVGCPRVVGGLTPAATARAAAFYRSFVSAEVAETDAATAEMVKLAENAFRDVNIAFANELALIARHHGLDAREVIAQANRHPRVRILAPGPGVGGHCVAVDPWFLAHGVSGAARLIPAARAVDAAMRAAVIEDAAALAAAGHPLICLGLTYKANVGDLRESPALHITQELTRRFPGGVIAVDPYVTRAPEGLTLLLLADALARPGALVLLTDHAAFATIPRDGRTVLDTRGLWPRHGEPA